MTIFSKLGFVLIITATVLCGCNDSLDPVTKREAGKPAITKETIVKTDQQGTQNHLFNEKSPYLLQHADNPVNWYPWGTEAFEKAKKENKPIFLSIGYSTCHWCHVMEHESFEDEDVAKLLNASFVCIKVDREERPDIDSVYISVCQMLTEAGGWPLTIIMTPEKKPFYAGTYFPKETRFGRIGMMQLIPRISDAWINKRDEINESATQITTALQKSIIHTAGSTLDKSVIDNASKQLKEQFDDRHGGFGKSPKFPTPHNLLFLLRYWNRTGDDQYLNIVEKTLQSMKLGGIYDHIGFGFHRYSTDRKWLVPHFEKMLYDQALIAMAYTETYQATGKEEYADTAREIFSYILRDMTDANGGFYSAEDADSEGVEGKFYVWTEEEIRKVLNSEEADLAITVFNIEPGGNFDDVASTEKTTNNILHLQKPLSEIASNLKISTEALAIKLSEIRAKLFSVREKRIHPYKDDKILTDWNGLMIAALAKSADALDEPIYRKAAERASAFVMSKMYNKDGTLLHRYRDDNAAISGQADDYAFMIWGLIELYQCTFDAHYLDNALKLNKTFIDQFWDKKNGGFYFTAENAEQLLIRSKETYDGAVPSANSVAMLNLLRLSSITASVEFEKTAEQIGAAFSENIQRSSSAHTFLMSALDFAIGPSYEVVIIGSPNAKDTLEMLQILRKSFIPNKVVLLKPTDQQTPDILKLAPFLKEQSAIDNKATAYVCIDHNCKLPTNDPKEMMRMLNSVRKQ